jgi:hypothetical protein
MIDFLLHNFYTLLYTQEGSSVSAPLVECFRSPAFGNYDLLIYARCHSATYNLCS